MISAATPDPSIPWERLFLYTCEEARFRTVYGHEAARNPQKQPRFKHLRDLEMTTAERLLRQYKGLAADLLGLAPFARELSRSEQADVLLRVDQLGITRAGLDTNVPAVADVDAKLRASASLFESAYGVSVEDQGST